MMKPKPLRLQYMDASELPENPQNWREHPPGQETALRDLIARVGWAGAALYNEATGRLIDGHLRKRIAEGKIPVIIGSWTEEEERLILASLDPITAMVQADDAKLAELLLGIETDSEALEALFDSILPKADEPVTAPEDFPEFDESIETEHKCPKCGYTWSGKAK